jgi:predicted Fe-Mo cluster-binding NifX family protein
MRFAIPCDGEENVVETFGTASSFAFLDANPVSGHILWKQVLRLPETTGETLSRWLADHGTDMLLAPDLNRQTITKLTDCGVQVACGATGTDPETLVESYLSHQPG